MHFDLPVPRMIFDVVLEDGAKTRVRRHGNPEGAGFSSATAMALPPTPIIPTGNTSSKFDLLVFDCRNHGQKANFNSVRLNPFRE
jgi:hypothetical protein